MVMFYKGMIRSILMGQWVMRGWDWFTDIMSSLALGLGQGYTDKIKFGKQVSYDHIRWVIGWQKLSCV